MEGQSSTRPPTFMATRLSTVGPNSLKDNTSHYCFTAPSGVPLPCHTLSVSSCCHPKCFVIVSALSMEMKKGEQLPEADFLALAFHKPSFPFLAGFLPLAFPGSLDPVSTQLLRLCSGASVKFWKRFMENGKWK